MRLDRNADLQNETSVELSIVMHCLNEAQTIGTCIEKARSFVDKSGILAEVIVADNGSTDGSVEIAVRQGAIVEYVARPGYGAALNGGIERARGRYVIFADADDSYDFSDLMPLVDKLREGHDLVIGDRFGGQIEEGAMPPMHRYVGNPILSGIGRFLYKSPVQDFHCGLRGLRREIYPQLQLKSDGMEFASEMIVKATMLGMRIAEVPITLYPDGRDRAPHLRTWRDGWRHLRLMVIHSPRWLFFYPGLLTFLLGLFIVGWLFPGPRTVGAVTLDVHTMLYGAIMIIVGLQGVSFALFASQFTANANLLPRDDGLMRLLGTITVERGVLLGLILFAVGLSGTLYAVLVWGDAGYGDLLPTQMMRLAIPSVTALACGAQVVFISFFMGVLRLAEQ